MQILALEVGGGCDCRASIDDMNAVSCFDASISAVALGVGGCCNNCEDLAALCRLGQVRGLLCDAEAQQASTLFCDTQPGKYASLCTAEAGKYTPLCTAQPGKYTPQCTFEAGKYAGQDRIGLHSCTCLQAGTLRCVLQVHRHVLDACKLLNLLPAASVFWPASAPLAPVASVFWPAAAPLASVFWPASAPWHVALTQQAASRAAQQVHKGAAGSVPLLHSLCSSVSTSKRAADPWTPDENTTLCPVQLYSAHCAYHHCDVIIVPSKAVLVWSPRNFSLVPLGNTLFNKQAEVERERDGLVNERFQQLSSALGTINTKLSEVYRFLSELLSSEL
eukprot:1149577-Pelagomonas_calceolata.AAC.7